MDTARRFVTIPPWLAACLVSLFFVPIQSAWACRIIIPPWPPPPWHPPAPRPIPRPPRRPAAMQVTQHHAFIEVREHVADVTVDAVFHNPNPFQIEGTYVFPVGSDAAVSSFTMSMNGKTLEAELLDAKSARAIYEDIVRRLKDPALLEYAGEGLLKARVFPIEPHRDVRIRLTYEMAAPRDGDLTRIRYPLLSAKPGGEEVVQDARIEIHLEQKTPIKTLFAPGFDVSIERQGNRRATVVWKGHDLVPDRDFELLLSTDRRRVGVEFLAYREDEEGYFMMMIAPDSELQAEAIEAKDITFVMDTSGSMMGEKIRQARQALTFCIQALNPEDRFNVISFATDVTLFAEAPVPANQANRREARDFVAGLRARGGTAMYKALDAAMETPAASDRPAFVVFLTDGMPTVGETDPATIRADVRKAAGTRRLFAFGVGYDVNTRLLDGLCQDVRGTSSYVRPKENLEIALSTFYEKIAHPVMTDLRIEGEGLRLSELNPPELPDLFRGSELRITGRYRGEGRKSLVLSGEVSGTRENIRFNADLDGNRRNTFIPRMWAMGRVGYLQEQIRINGTRKELVDEIKRLGRKYGIVTEYTSLLIVEDNVDRARLGQARRAFRESEAAMDRMESGALAVESAVRSKSLQSTAYGERGGMGGAPGGMPGSVATPNEPVSRVYEAAGLRPEEVANMVKQAGRKTFYLRRNTKTWYDSEIPAGERPTIDVELTAWSDEFFDWVARYPDLATYLRVGERLVVVIDGQTVSIKPGE